MSRLKTLSVFVGDGLNQRRIFESVRMALGMALRGNMVKLIVSPGARDKIENFSSAEMKKEIKEFMKALEELGGEVKIMNFSEALSKKEIDSDNLDFDIIIL